MILQLQTIDFQSAWSGWTSDDVLSVFKQQDVEIAHNELVGAFAKVRRTVDEVSDDVSERIAIQRRNEQSEMEASEWLQIYQQFGEYSAHCGVSF